MPIGLREHLECGGRAKRDALWIFLFLFLLMIQSAVAASLCRSLLGAEDSRQKTNAALPPRSAVRLALP